MAAGRRRWRRNDRMIGRTRRRNDRMIERSRQRGDRVIERSRQRGDRRRGRGQGRLDRRDDGRRTRRARADVISAQQGAQQGEQRLGDAARIVQGSLGFGVGKRQQTGAGFGGYHRQIDAGLEYRFDGVSIVAGVCEEIVFRGYLQRQLPIGVASQAIVFGVSHGYQGVRSIINITVIGLLFGVAAKWRRGLVPGMIAHAATDIAGVF